MTRTRSRVGTAIASLAVLSLAACGSDGGGTSADAEFEAPDQVTVVVHTGPGGGGDTTARQVIAMMEQEEIIEPGSWTVENREGGGSAVAVNYMMEQEGREDILAVASNVWLTNAMVTEGVEATSLDLTPLAGLYQDRFGIAVNADSPYQTLDDFIQAAEAEPNTLIQVGGSNTSNDALVGQTLMRESGATWRFLSFASGGERRTALLRGDADIYLSETGDLSESVEAGDMRLLAIAGDEASPLFPDVPTTADEGFTEEVPRQVRYGLAPPGISQGAIDYYEGLFEELSESETYSNFIRDYDAEGLFRSSEELGDFLQVQEDQHIELFEETGQLIDGYGK